MLISSFIKASIGATPKRFFEANFCNVFKSGRRIKQQESDRKEKLIFTARKRRMQTKKSKGRGYKTSTIASCQEIPRLQWPEPFITKQELLLSTVCKDFITLKQHIDQKLAVSWRSIWNEPPRNGITRSRLPVLWDRHLSFALNLGFSQNFGISRE